MSRQQKAMRVAIAAAMLISAGIFVPGSAATTLQSLYSSLDEKSCKTLPQQQAAAETANAAMDCGGIAGFHLFVYDDDDRASISIVTPAGKPFPQDYWNVVTPYFSSLGAKAEWRAVREQGRLIPIAVIIRVRFQDLEDSARPRMRSVLAVTKITSEAICLVRIIKDASHANDEARKVADTAATLPCLPPR